MSRLVKIDLVTCGGFKQKSLCSEKTVCILGVHWNFFSSREVIGPTRTGYNSSVCLSAEVFLPCSSYFSSIVCLFDA